MNDDVIAGFLVGAVLAGLIGWLVCDAENGTWQNDAVAHGAAEYVLNTADGTTTWRWKQ